MTRGGGGKGVGEVRPWPIRATLGAGEPDLVCMLMHQAKHRRVEKEPEMETEVSTIHNRKKMALWGKGTRPWWGQGGPCGVLMHANTVHAFGTCKCLTHERGGGFLCLFPQAESAERQ